MVLDGREGTPLRKYYYLSEQAVWYEHNLRVFHWG